MCAHRVVVFFLASEGSDYAMFLRVLSLLWYSYHGSFCVSTLRTAANDNWVPENMHIFTELKGSPTSKSYSRDTMITLKDLCS